MSFSQDRPPSPPRLRSTDLPEDGDPQAHEPEPFLSGHPILPEDMDIADLTHAQLFEMNQNLVEESMKSDCPLISSPEAISILRDEYAKSPYFQAQIDTLNGQGYKAVIRAKGDGNCFYRALAFAYLDRLIRSPGQNKDQHFEGTNHLLASAGFDDLVYGEPYEILQRLACLAPESDSSTNKELLKSFQDAEISNYIVMYMRLLTSAKMRVGEFSGFLFNPDSQIQMPVDEFCRQFVEPIGKEADHAQVLALAQALNVHVRVAYLDGRAINGSVNFFDFSEDAKGAEPVVLLYRPGHYDILEKKV